MTWTHHHAKFGLGNSPATSRRKVVWKGKGKVRRCNLCHARIDPETGACEACADREEPAS